MEDSNACQSDMGYTKNGIYHVTGHLLQKPSTRSTKAIHSVRYEVISILTNVVTSEFETEQRIPYTETPFHIRTEHFRN